jgi:biotin transport system substrate-specific component
MIKTLTKEVTISRTTERIIMVSLFALLTFAAALIKIYTPLSVVPFTMQTFVLFMSVYYLSPKENGISQASYILTGMVGAPVFAAGIAGALILVGPTAGYLLGFVVSAFMMSYMVNKAGKLTYVKAAVIFTTGSIVILALGCAHLIIAYKMNAAAALAAGFVPFIPAEAAKIAAAAGFFGLKK